DSPSNRKFVEMMQKDFDNLPGMYSSGTYLNAMCIEAALQKTGGKTDDKQALMDALRAVKIAESPRGPFHFDDKGNAVGNIFIRKVEKKNGKLANAIVKTYENVSQFWTYEPAKFLAEPVYSRDYPPAKHLEQ
ncbi:MAG TPA: ABC transporter substrate-binding protein, partial [Acetobacteraceae bacterium]|nr:ABC transporter substrate-binding protein [Acetobacteraceae bacterium]